MDGLEENRAPSSGVTRRRIALAVLAAAAAGAVPSAANARDEDEQATPEEKYARRFPQRVHVSDVLGKPLLDDGNTVIGRVQSVVRTREGRVEFIIPYGGLFGIGQRLVAVPIETVASIGEALLALDMPKEKFTMAPTWYGVGDQVLDPNAEIRVAVSRR
jgi:sporulation protein YlmC with PRC-barrel domain